jgi:hypothetical protein
MRFIFSLCIPETSESSIKKLCAAATINNPPFLCSRKRSPTILQSLGQTYANTQLIWVICSIFIGLLFSKFLYPDYAVKKKSEGNNPDKVDDITVDDKIVSSKSVRVDYSGYDVIPNSSKIEYTANASRSNEREIDYSPKSIEPSTDVL